VGEAKKIYGKTLDVYLCILTASSPSLAQYHVNKLLDLKLIESDFEGKHKINDQESIEALRSFLLLRGMLIPRLIIYSALIQVYWLAT
jgi:hypothetical protein